MIQPIKKSDGQTVALLAEGVDRNLYMGGAALKLYVALLAEGVDRNIKRTSHKQK